MIFFFNFLSFAQPDEHQQIENQIDKCFDILANGDPDQAFLCLEKQKAVLEKTGYIKSVTVYYYTAISNIYLMKGEHQNTDEQEEDNLKNIFEKLLCVLENDKIYTDPNISLSKTAEIIKSNEKYVSSAIATYAKTNYSNFINSYRINQAKLLIYENNNLNINEVMYVCGFNSRTTFYEAFKKHTGMSPRQFKDLKTEAKLHI